MHAILCDVEEKLGIRLTRTREASDFSNDVLQQMRASIQEQIPPTDDECLDVIVFGSVARLEACGMSDLDFSIAAHRLPDDVTRTRKLLEAVVEAQRRAQLNKPGQTGMFGSVISAADITERIGLEQDTNLNHSRRVLLLQESASVFAPELHDKLIRAVLERYLIDYDEPKRGVPRFLLNDVVRYWRTIAVDYQAKRWEALEPNWGLRYIKLITSRKLAFAGMMASILRTEEATVDYFAKQFQLPSLARLAQLEPDLEQDLKGELGTVLEVADEFIEHLSNEGFRDESKKIHKAPAASEESRYGKAIKRAKELQRSFERLFFESESLRAKSITYLSF